MAAHPAGKRSKDTPMMRQYLEVKERYPDFLLLFRVGDFYECFYDDARTVSEALNIVLTRRSNGAAADIAMAGFPHHACEGYIARLVKKGFKVAVCDQVEDPSQAKGIVRREITDIVTPGITYSERILDDRQNNYLCALCFVKQGRREVVGVAFIDVTTAEFRISDIAKSGLRDMLQSVQPAEVLLSAGDREYKEEISRYLPQGVLVSLQDDWMFSAENADQVLTRHFQTHSLKGFGIEHAGASRISAAVILQYLEETQQSRLRYLTRISLVDSREYMTLDLQTRRNLEIISSMQDGSTHGSLLQVIDRTRCPMGARLLRRWLLHPLKQQASVEERLGAVDELSGNTDMRQCLVEQLSAIHDIERALARIATYRSTPREVRLLGQALGLLPVLRGVLGTASDIRLQELAERITLMPELVATIEAAVDPEAGATMRDGGYIRKGYSEELDRLRSLSSNARERLMEIQQHERSVTGISTLKVQYNKVFGYYIEVSRANSSKVPDYYEKKQTLVNSERYTIAELKEYESAILTAEEQSMVLEQQLFRELCRMVAETSARIQEMAGIIAEIDCLCSFAVVALENGYTRPVINESTELRIDGGRHPVLERILGVDEPYVANDCVFDAQHRMMIVTGPNMAGKSSYLRQVGLIVLLAQVGSFVPAERAEIGLVDRIFTRVGASDNLASGESTFLVEMNEAASILNNATGRSLVLLDEVGRGTSTYDGMSIAWAMSEYIYKVIGARTLFATHYHELAELEDRFPGICNYNATVTETADRVVFLRKIVRGASDNSYGIEVAKMAGMPSEVIDRAREILSGMEKREIEVPHQAPAAVHSNQIYLFEEQEQQLKHALKEIDIDRLRPVDALLELMRLKELAGKTGGRG
ncbi:MAG: DNA mismatch repair protein MutS [Prosthecochloris sp.]|nr:DNA mismatch repair protein MutS [Prosthecochloris sp.]